MSDPAPAKHATLLRVLSTEDDANRVFDPLRIQFLLGCALAIVAMAVYLGLAVYHTLKSGTFDYTAFGTGFAALLAGFATYVGGTGTALFLNAKAPSS